MRPMSCQDCIIEDWKQKLERVVIGYRHDGITKRIPERAGGKESRKARGGATTRTDCLEQDS